VQSGRMILGSRPLRAVSRSQALARAGSELAAEKEAAAGEGASIVPVVSPWAVGHTSLSHAAAATGMTALLNMLLFPPQFAAVSVRLQ
jgi:hypothetical protein